MFSAGAGAADLFRERGILAMMGFKAGATYSVEQTRAKMMSTWKMAGSQFKGATADLAKTWKGRTSMMSDQWFQFKNKISEAGLMQFAEDSIDALLKKIGELKEDGDLDVWAADTAKGIIVAFSAIADYMTEIPIAWNTTTEKLKSGSAGLMSFLSEALGKGSELIRNEISRAGMEGSQAEGTKSIADGWADASEKLKGYEQSLRASAAADEAQKIRQEQFKDNLLKGLDEIKTKALATN